ncbi:MAG TPA: hypothetical protein VHW73_03640 [Rudaea sp.]|jgi:hypothetical protein|nr:hypothetical protein [Rudaea sp.]
MVTLMQLWLPIVLSAVFVFIASSLLNMLLQFWHRPDYHGFTNEEEVRAALRKGMTEPGMYNVPFCTMEGMKTPEVKQKFAEGPLAMIALKAGAPMSMGAPLTQWFLFCLVISFLCALLAAHTLAAGTPSAHVFHVMALAALLGHAAGPIPNAIWWSHTWRSSLKHVIDGVIYALIVGATFMWLWPA